MIITSTVLAPDGRRMSKSLGTGIDPLDAVARTAPTRPATACSRSPRPRRAVQLGRDRGRPQAGEQALERLPSDPAERRGLEPRRRADGAGGALDPGPDRRREAEIEEAWSAFDFATAANVLYHLTFDDFCDWYAEAVKPRLYDRDRRRRDGARRAGAAARAPAPGDAARERGDLVAPAGRARAL